MFLDYRKNSDEPQVTWVDFEGETEEVLAESFKAYLYEDTLSKREIREYCDTVYIVDAPVGDIVSILDESAAFTTFDDGYDHSGYEQFRVDCEVGIICVVRDVYVRKGFVRASDPAYEKLKDLMPEKVKKVEVADGYESIIDVTNSYYMKNVLTYLKEKGFSIVPVKRDFY
ncbi:MAG: hypothetical protein AB8H12_18020 [Lewinella sp.]